MKTLFCSLVILSLVISAASTSRAQHSYLGVRVGTSLANESIDSLPAGETVSMHAGFLAGAQYEYWFDNMWSVGAQVLYDQKGMHEDVNETEEGFTLTGTSDVVFSYLEIPIVLKATFGTGTVQPYVFAGPSVGMFLSGSSKVHASADGFTSDTTMTIPDSEVNSPDLSLLFGAGVSMKLSSGPMLFLDAGYALGLVNIAHTQPGDNTTAKSRDIRIAAGVLFPLD